MSKPLTPAAELALLIVYERHPQPIKLTEMRERFGALLDEYGTPENAVKALAAIVKAKRPLQ